MPGTYPLSAVLQKFDAEVFLPAKSIGIMGLRPNFCPSNLSEFRYITTLKHTFTAQLQIILKVLHKILISQVTSFLYIMFLNAHASETQRVQCRSLLLLLISFFQSQITLSVFVPQLTDTATSCSHTLIWRARMEPTAHNGAYTTLK